MKIPTVGTIGSIALLGGIGYVAYKFLKGDWKLPELPTLPEPDPQTIKETGVVGGVGDVIYNIVQAPELRERVEARADVADVPYSKAVAEVVSEDIHEQGLGLSLLKAPVTIGAGLGAIFQQGKYLETLPEDERIVAERLESEQRLKFKSTPEGIAATSISSIFPPIGLITATSTMIDVARVTAPPAPVAVPPRPAPPPAAAPWRAVPPPAAAPWTAPLAPVAADKIRTQLTKTIKTPVGMERVKAMMDLKRMITNR